MTKTDIITSAPAAQGDPVNRDIGKYSSIPAFKGNLEEMKVHVFNMRRYLGVDAFYVTMNNLNEMISLTYKIADI